METPLNDIEGNPGRTYCECCDEMVDDICQHQETASHISLAFHLKAIEATGGLSVSAKRCIISRILLLVRSTQ